MKGTIYIAAICLMGQVAWGAVADSGLTLAVTVLDSDSRPIIQAPVQLRAKGAKQPLATANTDEAGKAQFPDLTPRAYEILINQPGFDPVLRAFDATAGGVPAVEITLVPASHKESVEVSGTLDPVDQGSTTPAQLTGATAKELPNRPATVSDALPLIPGVVREPGGALLISASPEHRSAMIVNSTDVTDPATGQFGLTVPIDSVETLNVYQTPYLAEYGRFTAGLVTVETRRGGDQWKWELNDPLPEFRIRSYHLRGLKTATPRLNFEGPLIAGKLYFSEGFEYEVRRVPVYTLPFPFNQKTDQGINSFAQLDWISSARNILTATAHVAPHRMGNVNLDFYNPLPTTPDASTHNYTGTLADRLTLGGGLLESIFSVTQFDAAVWPHGHDPLEMTPEGNTGNYYLQKSREAQRISGASIYAFAPVRGLGTHNYKIGLSVSESTEDGQVNGTPIEIRNEAGALLQRITFPRSTRQFDIDDREYNIFAEDHWVITPRFSLDLGGRAESQQISGAFRLAPRGGFAWSPTGSGGTVVRGGFGVFYDKVPLNIYAFNRYPDRSITYYGADGQVAAGPYLFLNTLGQSKVRFPFVFQRPTDGNFSPRSLNWSLQVEQRLTRSLRLRAAYLQKDSAGLAIIDPVTPDPVSGTGAYLLEGLGQSRYRQFELTARLKVSEQREVFFSYVYSRARGDLNDYGNYLGTFPGAIIRDNQFGNLPGSVPNRFLAWGVFQLPFKFRVSPLVEMRSGFPWARLDASQEFSGVPNRDRYPGFVSIDSRFSKDIQVNPKYAVRVSVSGFNLTNHFNPEAVRWNTSDPAFGYFFGHRGRRFTADFDFLF